MRAQRKGAARNGAAALNSESRPMKLYENVIKALFVSFRSERGRGVIRNAFAPRDGGHLLLHSVPLLSRSLIFSRPLFLFSSFHPFFSPIPLFRLRSSRNRKSLLPFLSSSFSLSLSSALHTSKFLSSAHGTSVVEDSKKEEEAGSAKKAGRWENLATEGE